jgi:hypothetical protein
MHLRAANRRAQKPLVQSRLEESTRSLTFISLIDRAEPECAGTVPWLTDLMIVIYVSRLRNIHHTNLTFPLHDHGQDSCSL